MVGTGKATYLLLRMTSPSTRNASLRSEAHINRKNQKEGESIVIEVPTYFIFLLFLLVFTFFCSDCGCTSLPSCGPLQITFLWMRLFLRLIFSGRTRFLLDPQKTIHFVSIFFSWGIDIDLFERFREDWTSVWFSLSLSLSFPWSWTILFGLSIHFIIHFV